MLWRLCLPSTVTAGCRSSSHPISIMIMGLWRLSPTDCHQRTWRHGPIEQSGSEQASWRELGRSRSLRLEELCPMLQWDSSHEPELCIVGCDLSIWAVASINVIGPPM